MFSMRIEGLADLQRKLDQYSRRVSRDMQKNALLVAVEPARKAMVVHAPLEPGKPDLRDTIIAASVRAQDSKAVAVAVGPTKSGFYGCVFDAHTYVPTHLGQKHICDVRVGDKVLTQTGEFRSVIGTTRYPAIEKPDLVTIEARYRKGSVHRLTLTTDHHVLVFRDGKHKWVEAGTLVVGDSVSKRRKTSWSDGTAAVEHRECEGCGRSYVRRHRGRMYQPNGTSQGRRFCSSQCRSVWLAQRHVGMKRSEESRERMAQAARDKYIRNPELHPNRILAKKGFETSHEKSVSEWLKVRGIRFRPQHKIGNVIVDFYLPDSDTVIEADGAFWHQDQARDIERDRHILDERPDVRIVHMHFSDARFTPQLDVRPFPNVVYVACNPGPSSFVDPDVFMATEVLSVKHWTYRRIGTRSALLYDLSVDGVHSFVASGLVIHNSFQEFGTSRHGAQPFVRPGFDETVQEVAENIADELRNELDFR